MTASNAIAQLSTLTGVIERITFHSSESGYTVARLNTGNVKQLTTIVGSFANLQAGQTLQLEGIWTEHPNYGCQFQVKQYQETKPATLTGIEKYLGSGLIKGVGPVTAKRIVKHFGLETLDIIENQIYRLSEVPGIAKKRIAMIQSTWDEQKSIKDVMVFLSSHGVSTTYAVKIYKQYGDEAIATVTTNPYQLAIDIFGIGFLTADKIAVNVGVSPWSKFRYRAGVLHVLDKASEDGHCYLPESQIIPFTKELLTTDEHQAEERAIAKLAEGIALILSEMVTEEQLVKELDEEIIYYKPTFYHSERHLAKLLQQKLETKLDVESDRVMQLKNDYNKEVFNGDLGIVRAIDKTEKEVTIDFDGRDVTYDYADLNEITLAWATSIHKSQGSEYPVVILPLYTQHYVMLSRNLFYTGLTRAKKLALIVGSEKAIAIAVKQVKQQQRYTRLRERLEGRIYCQTALL